MSTSLQQARVPRMTPSTVVVPRQTAARTALSVAEQVTALKRLKRSLHLHMSIQDVRATIDANIEDLEARLAP